MSCMLIGWYLICVSDNEYSIKQVLDNWMTGLCCELSRCQLYIDFNQLLQLQETIQTSDRAERYNTQHLFVKLPSGNIVSTFCADSAHWCFYNKRLIKHALFIPRVNSYVLAIQIRSLVNSP